MSDLISRERLLKEINSCNLQITGMRMDKGALRELLQQYIDHVNKTIMSQPTVSSQDPAEERPPGTFEEYIPKKEVLDLIHSTIDRDIVNEYIYELKGIWIETE